MPEQTPRLDLGTLLEKAKRVLRFAKPELDALSERGGTLPTYFSFPVETAAAVELLAYVNQVQPQERVGVIDLIQRVLKYAQGEIADSAAAPPYISFPVELDAAAKLLTMIESQERASVLQSLGSLPIKRGPGRPKGSRNKPKHEPPAHQGQAAVRASAPATSDARHQVTLQ